MRAVVDTNVLIAANGRNTHADLGTIANCSVVLADIQRGAHLLLDDAHDLILREYKNYCHFSGQPGVADRFFLWYIRARFTPTSVARISLSDPNDVAVDLPAELHAFDKSDHKWVAVYLRGEGDVIYNAMDSDWEEHAGPMRAAGINVVQLRK